MKTVSPVAVPVVLGAALVLGAMLALSSVIHTYLYIHGYPYVLRSGRQSCGGRRFLRVAVGGTVNIFEA
jgi:hypothetical protein